MLLSDYILFTFLKDFIILKIDKHNILQGIDNNPSFSNKNLKLLKNNCDLGCNVIVDKHCF